MVLRAEFALGSRPLEAARYAGAIDNVGGEMLAGLTRQVDFWGNIASVGLAGGAELKTTVMPFILRGVSLLGINSSATPRAERLEVWQRIARRSRAAAPRAHRQRARSHSRNCPAPSRPTSTERSPGARS